MKTCFVGVFIAICVVSAVLVHMCEVIWCYRAVMLLRICLIWHFGYIIFINASSFMRTAIWLHLFRLYRPILFKMMKPSSINCMFFFSIIQYLFLLDDILRWFGSCISGFNFNWEPDVLFLFCSISSRLIPMYIGPVNNMYWDLLWSLNLHSVAWITPCRLIYGSIALTLNTRVARRSPCWLIFRDGVAIRYNSSTARRNPCWPARQKVAFDNSFVCGFVEAVDIGFFVVVVIMHNSPVNLAKFYQ